jgi:HAE1 family hydrophobic/amphiphilic exporter-1
MAAIMILGAVTLLELFRETFPEIKNDKVEIRIVYKDATTAEVEDAICRRVEDALDGINDIDEVAREGLGIATAQTHEGAQMARFVEDVKSEIDAITDFPLQAEAPIIQELGRTDAVVSIAIAGVDEPVLLKAYTEDLKSRLQMIDEISGVTLKGFSTHQLQTSIPTATLRRYGLSVEDIALAVHRQSVGSPAGELRGGCEDELLRFNDRRKTVAEIDRLVIILGVTGAAIRLDTIAHITDGFELEEQKVLFNGRRAAVLDITKTCAQDTLLAFEAVREFVQRESTLAPAGIELALTQDRSSVVRDRLDMLIRNGAQGLVAVFRVPWLLFSVCFSFWVTMDLPVTFLSVLFLMPVLGVSINMISMVGLLIGIGLLMDDAIVIAENIGARRDLDDSPMQAAVTGVKQVVPGVLSSFATTVLVFGSLAFITGEIGQILRVMPIVLIIVIAVSLIEAFLILPSHLGHSLAHGDKAQPSRFRTGFEHMFAYLRDHQFGPLADRDADRWHTQVHWFPTDRR